MTYYILDEQNTPVPVSDVLEWAEWFNGRNPWIGDTTLSGIRVSTRYFGTEGCLWETMVFADEEIVAKLLEIAESGDEDIQKRYSTLQEAQQGHKTMCVFIETCLTKGLLT